MSDPVRYSDRYGYSTAAARYRDLDTGRWVGWERTVRPELDAALAKASDRTRALSQQLVDREISLAAWQAAMMTEIKRSHLYAAALANGGWGNLGPRETGAAGRAIRDQYAYLRRFAEQIADGTQARNGSLVTRAAMYGQAGRGFYERERMGAEVSRGAREARSLRHALDSCPGCIEQAALGWTDVANIIPPGSRACRGNCKCTVEYRRG